MCRPVRLPRCAAVVFVVLLGAAGPVAAQEPAPEDVNAPTVPQADAIVAAVEAHAAAAAPSIPAAPARRDRRPAALVPLYVGYGALQALDIHSTSRALGRGGVESNPLMKGLAGNKAALLAVKAGAGVGVIYASEKMWRRRSRTAAVIFMAAVNTAMTVVVERNYGAGRN